MLRRYSTITGPLLWARLLAKREIDAGGCWNWTGARFVHGYGKVRVSATLCKVPQIVAWMHLGWTKGDGIHGLVVCHRCNNKRCFNPDHLYLAPNETNIRDAHRDGLMPRSKKRTKAEALVILQALRKGESVHDLATRFQRGIASVRDLAEGRTWKNLHVYYR